MPLRPRACWLPPCDFALRVIRGFCFVAISLHAAPFASAIAEEIIRNPDFPALERENELWRNVNPTLGLEANIERLRGAGMPSTQLEIVTSDVRQIWADKP